MLLEEVHREVEHTQHRDVEADIELACDFPGDILVEEALEERPAAPFGLTIEARLEVGTVVGAIIYDIEVDEAFVPSLVVTCEPVGGTDLEVVDGLLERLPEGFVADVPPSREGGEEAIAVSLGEVLRARDPGVDLHHIAAIVLVVDTSSVALTAVWERADEVVVRIIHHVLVLIVEQHPSDIVLAEGAVVVQEGLEVEATVPI